MSATLGRARAVVLSAPSGTGKTTIAHRLVATEPDFEFSVSATTRAPRPGEQDGVDYDFVDEARFEQMIAAGELAEWARVHGRWYGTPLANLERAAASGTHALLDIDVQGAAQIRARVPDALLVFVLPPSVAALVARLRGRGTEDAAELANRLRSALVELEAVEQFDHVVVNDDLDRAVARIGALARGRSAPDSADPQAPRALARTLRDGVRDLLADPEALARA